MRDHCPPSIVGSANRSRSLCLRALVSIPFLGIALTLLLPTTTLAGSTIIHGQVTGPSGHPIGGANIFLFETLEGAVSDAEGRFTFGTSAVGPVTLVIRAEGYLEERLKVRLPLTGPVAIRLAREAVLLDGITVAAGRLTTGSDPELSLHTLQVVTTPGAAADIYRAVQTFAGLQQVDEGAGLFVRGGDLFETKVFLNDAAVLSPYRYESPTGGFFGAFDPFILDGISFSTGGFGARYGDALSGIAALSTRGIPPRRWGGLTISLANHSATLSLPLAEGLGANLTATRTSTDLLFRLNGTTTEFTDPPSGSDLSGGLTWEYRETGSIELFGLSQRSALGVVVEEPAYGGELAADEEDRFVVLSWRDEFRGLSSTLSLSWASSTALNDFGALNLRTGEGLDGVRGELSYTLRPWLTLRAGGEGERRRSSFTGTIPAAHYDSRPGARAVVIDSRERGHRHGAFTEADLYVTPDLRLTTGLRTDRSSLSGSRSWDPRLAAAYRISDYATLLGAWGIYHQVAAPWSYERAGGMELRPMRARHSVVGLQLEGGGALLRAEGYRKDYRGLVQERRDRGVSSGGWGRSRGLDLFLQWPELWGLGGRISWSLLRAERTDPESGVLARSPFDITHSVSLIVDYRFLSAWQVSSSVRYATGRPYTPVIGAVRTGPRGPWRPEYGAPYSERFPSFQRTDLSLNRLASLGEDRLLILFVAISNLFDRVNIYDLTYTEDYSEPRPLRSQFNRSIYFGASLTF